jgi:hypothetical protein
MWNVVKWTLAGQITPFFKLSDAGAPLLDGEEPPEQFFSTLRDAGAYDDALQFLSYALPRRVAIAWGRDCVGRTASAVRLTPQDIAAYSAVGAWLSEPSDEQRYVAFDAAKAAVFGSAEALLATAVYTSGGSLAAPHCPQPCPPPPEMAGQMVAGALAMAATRVEASKISPTKAEFLDRGSLFAAGQAR